MADNASRTAFHLSDTSGSRLSKGKRTSRHIAKAGNPASRGNLVFEDGYMMVTSRNALRRAA